MAKYGKNKVAKKRKTKFRIDMVVISCAIAFVACFVIYIKTAELAASDKDFSKTSSQTESVVVVDNSLTPSNSEKPSSDSVLTEEASSQEVIKQAINPVPECESVGMQYFDGCIFIGDSLTFGLASYNLIKQDNVIASIGMNVNKIDTELIKTTSGDITALDALKKAQPKNVYLMLGSNGIAWLSNESMIEKYGVFVDEVTSETPNTTVYILSIPPVTEGKETASEGSVLNSKIDGYNSELLNMANEKNVYYVDINTALKNNQGKLDTDKAQKDGMHFQKATYDIMLNYIMTHVSK